MSSGHDGEAVDDLSSSTACIAPSSTMNASLWEGSFQFSGSVLA